MSRLLQENKGFLRIVMMLWAGSFASAALAQNALQTYGKETIRIMPQTLPPEEEPIIPQSESSLPWLEGNPYQAKRLPEQNPPKQPFDGYRYKVEMRDASSVHSQGWFTLSAAAQNEAAMLVFDAQKPAQLPKMNEFSPLDVLCVSAQGIVQEITPNVIAAQATKPLVCPAQTRAILLLSGGQAAAKKLATGDQVIGALFSQKTNVQILDETSQMLPSPVGRTGAISKAQSDQLMQQIQAQKPAGKSAKKPMPSQ